MRKIGITIGDPKGIGSEIILKALSNLCNADRKLIQLYGERYYFEKAASLLDINLNDISIKKTSSYCKNPESLTDTEAGSIALRALDACIEDLKTGSIESIVTAPLNKKRIKLIVSDFIGHTEYLDKKIGNGNASMMFNLTVNTRQFFISLVTTHLAVENIASAITQSSVNRAIQNTNDALKNTFKIQHPKIAVLSLNPHAGESGAFGRQEIEILIPTIKQAVLSGIECTGPIAADAFFTNLQNNNYVACIAMYHDQAMIPAKILSNGNCVNITLGLKYLRTSPGHGTAEDIAGKNIADFSSILSAINLNLKSIK